MERPGEKVLIVAMREMGAGVVRLSLGDDTELGGTTGGGYARWNFFTDATVTFGDEVWVRDGKMAVK